MKIFTTNYSLWNVFYRKNSETLWHQVKGPHRYWYADPILKEWRGKKYLFMEAYDMLWSVGRIAVSVWDGERFSTPEIVIKKPYHMSYPFVFEYEDALYMLPETGQNRTLEIYRAENDSPFHWSKIKVLSDDTGYADATVVLYEGIYYIIAYEECEGEWKTHIFLLDMEKLEINHLETIISHDNTGKPAGRTFEIDGTLYRPVQLNTEIYGGGIIIERINSFAPFNVTKMKEIKATRFESDILPKAALGTHTLAYDDEIYVVDMLVSDKKIYTAWIVIVRKVRNVIFRLLRH